MSTSSRYITIHHPKFGDSEVLPPSVPIWTERGWSVVEPKAKAKPKATPAAAKAAAKKTPAKTAAKPAPARSHHATAAHKSGDSTAPPESV